MKTKRILPILIVMLALILAYLFYMTMGGPVVEEPTVNEETPANETPGNEANVIIVEELPIEEPLVEEPPVEEPPAEEPPVEEPKVEESPVIEEIITYHDLNGGDGGEPWHNNDFFKVPEYPLGTVLGLVASVAAVGVVLKKQQTRS